MEIRELTEQEIPAALTLAWQVFEQFVAPGYPVEGVETFHRFLEEENWSRRLRMIGAVEGGRVVGLLAMRDSHISLFFVEKGRQRQGIGRSLLSYEQVHGSDRSLSVNAAPDASETYRRLGFRETDTEQLRDGIRYVPMVLETACVRSEKGALR